MMAIKNNRRGQPAMEDNMVVIWKGEVFRGTETEIVAKMARSARLGSESSRAYMRNVAIRVKDLLGKRVRIGSADVFIEDLAEAGVVDAYHLEEVGESK